MYLSMKELCSFLPKAMLKTNVSWLTNTKIKVRYTQKIKSLVLFATQIKIFYTN